MSYVNLPILSRGRTMRDGFAFPDEVFLARDRAVRKIAENLGLEGIIVFGGILSRGLVCYLNNHFNAFSYGSNMWIVPKAGESVMLVTGGERDIPTFKRTLPEFVKVIPIGLNLLANDHIGVQTVKYLKDNDLFKGKWGTVNGASIPYTAYQALIADGLPLEDITESFEDIKAIKDSNELYPISLASVMAQRAVYDFIRQASPGVSPIELAAHIDRGLRMNGVEHPSILISRGEETAFTVVEDTPLVEGEMISIFADIQFLHYHGAFATTAVVGGGNIKQNNLIQSAKLLLDKTLEDIASSRQVYIGYKGIDDSGSYVMVNSIGIDLVDAPIWEGKVCSLKPNMTLNVSVNLNDLSTGSAINSRTVVISEGGLKVLNDFGPQ